MKPCRAIILAAGKGFQLDGVNKILIRHPRTGRTILDHALDAFAGKRVTVVVGFRAIQIMEAYPALDYVINADWSLTNNAMSLGLALSEEPCYVVSGDIFFNHDLIEELDISHDNLVLTDGREYRALTAIHCVTEADNTVVETYQGPMRDINHPEAIGLFKITHESTLHEWRRLSLRHGNLFAGQTLPLAHIPVKAHAVGSHLFCEINTPVDYLRLIQNTLKSK